MLDQHGGPAARREQDGNGPPGIARTERSPNPGGSAASGSAVVLDRLQPVLDRLPEAILLTDPDGAIRLTNAAADRLFADEPIHDSADLLGRFEGTSAVANRSVAGEPARRLTVRPRHQPNTWYSLDRVPFDPASGPENRADDRVGVVWVLRDVTDTADLHAEREAFLAVLSHELRTPLTTIYAGSSVLARRGRLSPPATRMLAMDISAEAARLYDLVENLLVIARLERRILEPLDEPVDLGQALDFAIRTTTDRDPEAKIEREGLRRPPPVRGDTTYVEQACRNLLLAALRVGGNDSPTPLVVRVDHDAERNEVAVRVFDRGPALSEEELDQAFDLPADSGTGSRLEGSGMGPFVVRHVIDAMHGRTWALNREGGGLEMGFALPVDDRG